jgi:hypothetical protein
MKGYHDLPFSTERIPQNKTAGPERKLTLRIPMSATAGYFGDFHSKVGRTVQIEPSLRLPSPENGNISKNRQRLSTDSTHNPLNWESGDRPLNCKSLPFAGFSAIVRGQFPDSSTAWLATQC